MGYTFAMEWLLTTVPVISTSAPDKGRRTGRHRSTDRPVRSAIGHLILIAASIVMIHPLLWVLSRSFRRVSEIFNSTSLIPMTLSLSNYVRGWCAIHGFTFTWFFITSITITMGAIFGNLISWSMAAYAFARLQFRFRGVFFSIMLKTLMLPYHVTVVPPYMMFSKLHFVNTFVPLVLPKFLATDAFFVFLIVQFIRGLPANSTRRPGSTGVAIPGSSSTSSGRSWCRPSRRRRSSRSSGRGTISPSRSSTSPGPRTSPCRSRSTHSWTRRADTTGGEWAMSVLSLVPIFIAFPLGQPFLVRGIATTGIK